MGKAILADQTVAAGSQFQGNEFSIQAATPGAFLKLRELDLRMGTESKTFRVYKRKQDGTDIVLIQRSTDSNGNPAAITAESLILLGEDIEVFLAPGEQIQIETDGATSEMRAQLYFEEVLFRP
jgi:hypothetical protein